MLSAVEECSPTSESPPKRDLLKYISERASGIALLAGLLYVLGLYAAYRMDSSLGVGTIEVTRERAACIGVVQLILALPGVALWWGIRGSIASLSAPRFLDRLKAGLLVSFGPAFAAGTIPLLVSIVFGVQEVSILAALIIAPLVFVLMSLVQSPSFARRFLTAWPIYLLLYLSIVATAIGGWLPSEFGGHAGKSLTVILRDGTMHHGTHRVSDSKVIVLTTSATNIAISRDEILTVYSRKS